MSLPALGDPVKPEPPDQYVTLRVKRDHIRTAFEVATALAAGYSAYIVQGPGSAITTVPATLVLLRQYRRRR